MMLSEGDIIEGDVEHVYDYYDGPLLYTFKTKKGNRYLVLHLDFLKGFGNLWLYLELSDDVYREMEMKRMSVYQAFRQQKRCYLVRVDVRDVTSIEDRLAEEFEGQLLLEQDTYLCK